MPTAQRAMWWRFPIALLGLTLLAAGASALGLLTGRECEGHDEEWERCYDQPPCDGCVPVDCVFSSWDDWYTDGDCLGLHFRHRTVQTANNRCGRPCEGAKIESEKYLEPSCKIQHKDCVLTPWSDWSTCADDRDQATRSREVATLPEDGGKPCPSSLKETKPCGGPEGEDCIISDWHSWTACSQTCGAGRHSRMRRVLRDASNGGRPCQDTLLEMRKCELEACPSQDCLLAEWSSWSVCDSARLQRTRRREVLNDPVGTGKPCDDSLQETQGCDRLGPADCTVTDWTDWSTCSRSCLGGERFRERELSQPNRNGGLCPHIVLKTMQPCNTQPCFTEGPRDCVLSAWSAWSGCAVDSPDPFSMSRVRSVEVYAMSGGQGCSGPLEEVVPCSVDLAQAIDCRWGEWEEWSACTATCGGGSRQRSRQVAVPPSNGGASCKAQDMGEVAVCNPESCDAGCTDGLWGNWMPWTACSSSCDAGFRSRRRTVDVEANECGNPPEGFREEFQVCSNLPPCEASQDCRLSAWGDWGECSSSCFGTRERRRHVEAFASGNGAPCNTSLAVVEPCNPGDGEGAPFACRAGKAADCEISEWGEWSECSASCGGGQMEHSRRILVPAARGGRPCEESLKVTKACSTQPCEEACQDCEWNEWSDWSECSKCDGQRERHRSIKHLPNECGKRCETGSAKEMSNCTGQCNEALFCEWSEWSAQLCDGTHCGLITTMRSREMSLKKHVGGDYLFKGTDDTQCIGTQLEASQCPFVKSCNATCQPRDCVLAPWSEWNQPTCVGLCERQRVVSLVNNECGIPCSGPLVETKTCASNCSAPRDCVLSQWEEWSACAQHPGETDPNAAEQRFRRRRILVRPEHGGTPCGGSLAETDSCSAAVAPEPCVLSEWSEWSGCSTDCGDGTQRRHRFVDQVAADGGKQCEGSLVEVHPCRAQGPGCNIEPDRDCALGNWEDWSFCGKSSGQRTRTRALVRAAQGMGASCAGPLTATQSCHDVKVDCSISDWTEWDACDTTCGMGQKRRQRQIHHFPENGGKMCPSELIQTKGCDLKPCQAKDCDMGDWQDWGACSRSCGLGLQHRERDVKALRGPGGAGCRDSLGEARQCPDNPACVVNDCRWADWTAWSSCSASCSGGSKRRTREISQMPSVGGTPCDARLREEVETCNEEPCQEECIDGAWKDWGAWSTCSATCGGGTSFRTREIARMANDCGKAPRGNDREVKFCNEDVHCRPSRNCVFSAWTVWSACSASCSGVKSRARQIESFGQGGGSFCVGSLNETWPCNPDQGGLPPIGCTTLPPVDCELAEWQAWSACSATCAGGQHTRQREVAQMPAHGGKSCDGALSEVKECGRRPCDSLPPVDCRLGDWHPWGACDRCDGERKRFRSIVAFPAHGGTPCEAFDTSEVAMCPRTCHAHRQTCVWSDWGTWSGCTNTCGEDGFRRRQRKMHLGEVATATSSGVQAATAVQRFETRPREEAQYMDAHLLREAVAAFATGCLAVAALLATARSTRAAWRAPGLGAESPPDSGAVPLVQDSEVLSFEVTADWPRRTGGGARVVHAVDTADEISAVDVQYFDGGAE